MGNREHRGSGSSGEAQHRGNGSIGKPGSREDWEPQHRGNGKSENREHRGNGEPRHRGNVKPGASRNREQWGGAAPGVDFKMKTIEVDGIKVRIQIWDTAGQERYQTITKQYYRRAQGIFLVYDISSERSYQHIVKWASDVDEYAPDGVQKILIGNKADEEHKRQVPKEQGLQLAREYGMDFYETSACSNLNIKESFTRLTELVLQAHRKELDELRGLPRAPTLARLEEDEQQPLGSEDTPKTCWC
ncbi:ras-related protein Rab-15 isoform X2 [Anomalospiza imberbis]|uniref:ras-related protein Rab-15 isoform X2 n=1 Tax=Anomalospiza imberbis TaxID=187417 RepID=UPI00358F8C48